MINSIWISNLNLVIKDIVYELKRVRIGLSKEGRYFTMQTSSCKLQKFSTEMRILRKNISILVSIMLSIKD